MGYTLNTLLQKQEISRKKIFRGIIQNRGIEGPPEGPKKKMKNTKSSGAALIGGMKNGMYRLDWGECHDAMTAKRNPRRDCSLLARSRSNNILCLTIMVWPVAGVDCRCYM
jgi:hypothetical protein